MLEYIQFYTKNLSNFAILLIIGVVIAILDIAIRKVIRGVYLNVRENMRIKHGGGNDSLKEGFKNNSAQGGGGGSGDGGDDENCPKDCNAVEELRKRLTVLVENAKNLQNNINQNNNTIMNQQRIIENMKKAVDKVIEASNKKK
jgi:hypothetical protein